MAIEERDLSIDEARARAWINDVNHEIIQVESILKNVGDEITNVVDEDDPVMSNIESWAQKEREVWDAACKEFKKAMVSVEDGVNSIIDGFRKAVDDIKSHK